MRDKRPVDELSVEELERILAVKRREARQQRAQRMGRVIVRPADAPPMPAVPAVNSAEDDAAYGLEGMSIDDIKAQLRRAANPASETPPAETEAAVVIATPMPALADAPPEPALRVHSADPNAVLFEEDMRRRDGDAVEYVPRRNKSAARRLFDRALWAVEIAAVLGIVLIGANLLISIQKLNAETQSAQQMAEEQRRLGIPTIAPTPSLRLEDAVLPGGHVFTETGDVQFNYDEVPSHLRPLVQSQWIEPVFSRPPATSETALAITIPALNISQAIVQGVDWEALKQGVGQLVNGDTPTDDAGNVVLAAHNDVYGEVFRHLDQLQPGDEFQIQTQNRIVTYVVTGTDYVAPNDVSVLEPQGRPTATLISCYPYQQNTERIVVYADRVG